MTKQSTVKKMFFLMFAMMVLALPMFAQGSGGAIPEKLYSPLAAGIGMGLASGLCALGQGKAVAGAAEGMARNPAATGQIRFALILGLVLIESLALYTFAIIFVKV